MTTRARRGPNENVQGQNALNQITGTPACHGQGDLWSRTEAAYQDARTRLDRVHAAGPAVDLCLRCAVITSCHAWARQDGYTGLAAARIWSEGADHPIETPRARDTNVAVAS